LFDVRWSERRALTTRSIILDKREVGDWSVINIKTCGLIAVAGKHASLGLVEYYPQCAYNMVFF